MIRKWLPQKIKDYIIQWVSEVMYLKYTSAVSTEGTIHIIIFTRTADGIYKYPDYCFYDEL